MPIAKLDPRSARSHLQEFRFADLFVEDLGWNHPDRAKPLTIELDGETWHAREISQLSGFRVIEVISASKNTVFPDAKIQNALWKRVSPHAVENILIFVDHERTRSVWLWMKRDQAKTHPRRHYYVRGQPGDLFLSKLAALVVDLSELDEEGNIPITDTAARVRAGLDIETTTKKFFTEFAQEHERFLDTISGVPDGHDQRWYASVILNRLMFIWFLQKKAFLDRENRNYLPDLLAASRKTGKDRFYSHTLRDLFFEGFAKPASKRACIGSVTLGDIPYLNGGLFLPHGIETRMEGDALFDGPFSYIRIPDAAFEGVFRLFSGYSWSLNDTPGGDDREINPDVLGYIFEKYINQKEFGAYYTRPEITEYLCEQTIHQLVLEAANKHADAAGLLHKYGLKKEASVRHYETMSDLLLQADGTTCRLLLQQDIPALSLLDPACGSGAFLIAAMKTLLGITTGLVGRCEAIGEKAVLQWIETEKKKHKAPLAYWLKKKIITENLYGVDIMEEAVEIAKLRLFLALVASAEKRDQLEPLPNIEFNLMPGNSLIGLLHVDPAKYDRRTGAAKNGTGEQGRMSLVHEPAPGELGMTVESKVAPTKNEAVGAYLAKERSARYEELLREKNRLVAQYKQAGDWAASGEKHGELKALTGLREQIEAANRAAREILNRLLLDEFSGLGIQFEQATWDEDEGTEGKATKRPLKITDIEALHPFHMAYEFDEIILNRGGFDAIITNPPWEVFQTNEKEFFQNYAPTIQRKKLRIEDWQEQREKLLCDQEIRADWLAYTSRFPHQWVYFKKSHQYANQISTVDGKAVGNKPNLYNLFTEQCFNLLRAGGLCGIVIPSGIYTDLGAKQLRSMLFESSRVTGLFGFENRKKIFDNVDSRFKFVVLSFVKGGKTDQFPAAFMRHDVGELTCFPAEGAVSISVNLVRKLSPDSMSVMEFKDSRDVCIAEKMSVHPMLFGDDEGWNLELYGEELNMTRSAGAFLTRPTKSPLFEGGMIWQFDHRYSEPRYWVKEADLRQTFLSKRTKRIEGLDRLPRDLRNDYEVNRIAIRKIASNTNERTLIVAVVPPYSFAGNSLSVHFPFQHRNDAYNILRFSAAEMLVILSELNSFTVDYVLRSRMTTNLNLFYLYQLPIPRLSEKQELFRPLIERAARLVGVAPEFDGLVKEVFGEKANHETHGISDLFARQTIRAEIDALVARLYDLTDTEFAHILNTFPLVDESVKQQTLNTYRDLLRLGKLPETRL